MRNDFDVIVVGMGIAGIQISHHLIEEGLQVLHIHKDTVAQATPEAAGLINPITGRRFVKSWMIDEVMPYALQFYNDIEEKFDSKFVYHIDIVRVLKDYGEENVWLSKTADPYLAEFMQDTIQEGDWLPGVQAQEISGVLQNCKRVEIGQMQKKYIQFCKDQGVFLDDFLDYSDIQINESLISFKSFTAKHIIFAEGWKVLQNPFFQVPAFSPSKGEYFIIKSPELQLEKAYKKDQFITPLGQDLYWVGATYEWQNFTTNATEKMKKRIKEKLDNVIAVPYEIIEHRVGQRPSTKDRKPVIGTHPDYRNIHIFNGLGTKGTSLGPYFANMLVKHIWNGEEILDEVDIKRWL